MTEIISFNYPPLWMGVHELLNLVPEFGFGCFDPTRVPMNVVEREGRDFEEFSEVPT
jgi:hypothetical protein